MQNNGVARWMMLAAGMALLAQPVLAQEEVEMIVQKGTAAERPFTVIYPSVLEPIDDGSDVTVVTLRHPDAAMQCDAMIQDGASADWNAESALSSLDPAGIVTAWSPDFPGFRLTGQSLTQFQSGPALMFEAESDSSPFAVPLRIVHAEAVDGGRFYAVECLVEQSAAADARPMIDFIIANFSTRSDANCCVDPADPRG